METKEKVTTAIMETRRKTQKQTPTTKGTRNTEACSLGEPLQYIKRTLSLTTIKMFGKTSTNGTNAHFANNCAELCTGKYDQTKQLGHAVVARPALGYLILIQVYLTYHRYVISVDNNRDGNQRKSDNCNNGNKTQNAKANPHNKRDKEHRGMQPRRTITIY